MSGPARDQRLGPGAARRFALRAAIPAGTGRVLVCPADRGIHAEPPADPARRVRRGLQPRHHPRPRAVALPAAEQPVDRLPPAITPRHIPPRRARAGPPPNPVNQLPAMPDRPAPAPGQRQHPHQIGPLLIT